MTRDLPDTGRLEQAARAALFALVAALQVSIAAASLFLTATLGLWLALLVRRRERPRLPAFFRPLVAYTLLTMAAVAASVDPAASLSDAREVLLFLVVPAVYRLARGRAAATVAGIIVSVGAVTAIYGIVQYGILEYDHLGRRPQGSMGHYMTYSGLLMLVIGVAAARVLFDARNRAWAGLVLPALVVALALTFTRSAWVGACLAVGLLLVLKDLRLLAAAPVLAALFFTLAPAGITDRAYSMFDLQDPTNRDRFAMGRAGLRMVRDHPLTGVGPDMVQRLYPRYRDEAAVNETTPHLHNVPLQIAAERGLPALGAWLWFVAAAARELTARFRQPHSRAAAGAGLAALAGMLAAGMFEYNFGDSEFLMLLLVVLTLPAAAARAEAQDDGRQPAASGEEATPQEHGRNKA